MQVLDSDVYTGRFPSGSSISQTHVVVVGVDDQSLDALGGWPLKRTLLAQAAETAFSKGAKVVAFDIIFNKPQNGVEDSQIINLARTNKSTIFAIDEQAEKALFPTLLEASPTVGHAQAVRDAQDRVVAVAQKTYALSLPEVVVVAFCAKKPPPCYFPSAAKSRLPVFGSEQDSSWGINFTQAVAKFPRISLQHLLRGEGLPNFQNKIVVISPSAPRLGDMKFLPFDWKMPQQQYPGSIALAYGIETLLANNAVWTLPSAALILLLGGLNVLTLLAAQKRPALQDLIFLIATSLLLVVQHFLFIIIHLHLPILLIIFNGTILWLLTIFRAPIKFK
jgi:CHASE2 domain-containing sensor protein